MKTLKSVLALTRLKVKFLILFCGVLLFLAPKQGFGIIIIDINNPSVQTLKIAIPDFSNKSDNNQYSEFSTQFPQIIANDLKLCGYFTSMDKASFLEQGNSSISLRDIRFKNWSVIGADLLLLANYTCIGRSIEIEFRAFDVHQARLIAGKRMLEKIADHRLLMHRIANEIISALTGNKGMFMSKLAFVSTSSGHKELFISDFDGENIRQITNDKSIALSPRWSPKGDKLVYSMMDEKEGKYITYIKELATGKVSKISDRKGLNIGASWAPDGKSLVLSLSHGKNPDIYSIDTKGKINKRLVSNSRVDMSPSYSPDGKKIVFLSDRSGSAQIYVKDLKSGKEERITFFEGKYNTSPSWSARNRIVFASGPGGARGRDIYTINPDGRNLIRLTQDQRNNEDPCWSPDGRYIAFSSNRSGSYQLYIMNENGHNQRKITNLKGKQTSPAWSPY